jgi:hypothetical protein
MELLILNKTIMGVYKEIYTYKSRKRKQILD